MNLFRTTVLLTVAIVIGSFLLWNHEHKQADYANARLGGLVGSAIYQIWHNYDEFANYPPDDISVERLAAMNEKLIAISAYSQLVDQAKGTNLLLPVSNHLQTISRYLNSQLSKQQTLSQEDQQVYGYMLQTVAEIEPQIGLVYYAPGVHEGPKVALKPNRSAVQKMAATRDRLKDYVVQLNDKKQ
ncbi:hypothetical protein [Paenibacillus glycanilyticus]|uniref:LemA family protein n=1 Tax=Paenibacillus glycanilyticus TaxID=126569 RepID=A0ABQ6GCN9_9BACL|nr:hypothetical protein [Paenibacillus glycanilyticus]GLX68003.1 hypothetical protein MU1_23480 [Paenibacillus glycanilyticus]